jgi:hypothetical protein
MADLSQTGRPHIMLGRRIQDGLAVFLAVLGVFYFGLSAAEAATANSQLSIRKASISSTGGRFNITANCQSGEVRLGGGYKFSAPPLNATDALGVEESYPTGSKGWTVRGAHYNPDGQTRHITAEAYCLKDTNAVVQTVQSQIVRSQLGNYGRFFSATSQIFCPTPTIATGGGFRTSATTNYSGLHNAWISSFFPLENASGGAKGWRVALDAIPWPQPPDRPTLQSYAVCINPVLGPDRIESSRVVDTKIASNPQLGYTYLGPGPVKCPIGHVALGGGYQFSDSATGNADLLVPHPVFQSYTIRLPGVIQSKIPAQTGWLSGAATKPVITKPVKKKPVTKMMRATPADKTAALRARIMSQAAVISKEKTELATPPKSSQPEDVTDLLTALNTTKYFVNNAPDTLAPKNPTIPLVDFGGWNVGGIFGSQTVTQNLTGYASCIKLPQIQLTVKILTPVDLSTVGSDFSQGVDGNRTSPILLSALASDGNGQAVGGVTYSWMLDGVIIGSGASLSKALPSSSCGVDHKELKVAAYDSDGRYASDKVTVVVGQIC